MNSVIADAMRVIEERDRFHAALEQIVSVKLGPEQMTDPDWLARLMQGFARAALTGEKK